MNRITYPVLVPLTSCFEDNFVIVSCFNCFSHPEWNIFNSVFLSTTPEKDDFVYPGYWPPYFSIFERGSLFWKNRWWLSNHWCSECIVCWEEIGVCPQERFITVHPTLLYALPKKSVPWNPGPRSMLKVRSWRSPAEAGTVRGFFNNHCAIPGIAWELCTNQERKVRRVSRRNDDE